MLKSINEERKSVDNIWLEIKEESRIGFWVKLEQGSGVRIGTNFLKFSLWSHT